MRGIWSVTNTRSRSSTQICMRMIERRPTRRGTRRRWSNDLHAVVLAVADQHLAEAVDPDGMRRGEDAGPRSRSAPGRDQACRPAAKRWTLELP